MFSHFLDMIAGCAAGTLYTFSRLILVARVNNSGTNTLVHVHVVTMAHAPW